MRKHCRGPGEEEEGQGGAAAVVPSGQPLGPLSSKQPAFSLITLPLVIPFDKICR